MPTPLRRRAAPVPAGSRPGPVAWAALLAILLGSPGRAAEPQRILPANPRYKGAFGQSVAMSGDLLVVGEPHVCQGQGFVHVYQRQGCTWGLLERIDGPADLPGGEFGASLDLAGDLLVVGAPERDPPMAGGTRTGAARVYRRLPEGWSLEAELWPPELRPFARFGEAVAAARDPVGTDRIAVAAVHEADDGRAGAGAVHVFARREGEWAWEARLTGPSDGRTLYFGRSLAFQGERLLVGAHAACCAVGPLTAFVRSDGAWRVEQEVFPSADMRASRYPAFATAVAVDGRRIAVGAPGDTAPDGSRGAVRLFDLDASGHVETERLQPSVAGPDDGTGLVVDLAGDVVVAPLRDDLHLDWPRPLVAWERSAGRWIESARLGPEGGGSAWWGAAAATNGRHVAVGAPREDAPWLWSGAVDVYDLADRDGDCLPDQQTACAGAALHLAVERQGGDVVARWGDPEDADVLHAGPLLAAGVSPLHGLRPVRCGSSLAGLPVALEGSVALLVARGCEEGGDGAGRDSWGMPRPAVPSCP